MPSSFSAKTVRSQNQKIVSFFPRFSPSHTCAHAPEGSGTHISRIRNLRAFPFRMKYIPCLEYRSGYTLTVDNEETIPRPRLCRASCEWNTSIRSPPHPPSSSWKEELHTTRRFRFGGLGGTALVRPVRYGPSNNQTTKRECSVADLSRISGNSAGSGPQSAKAVTISQHSHYEIPVAL